MSLFDGYLVNQEINTVIKIYPGFIRLYKYKSPFIVRRFDYDPYNPNKTKKSNKLPADDAEKKSLSRAKTTVKDLALCNDFDQLATFTFNGNEENTKKFGYVVTNREDVDACKRKMHFWLNNQKRLHGKFKYIIVPEYHKDGALHFHAMLSEYKGRLIDSKKRKNKRKIYNIKSYKLGHSTLVNIDHLGKVSSYVAKYLTKEMPKFKNKQRYWCSNGLKRPLKIVNPMLNDADRKLFVHVYSDNHKDVLELTGELSDNDIARLADFGKRRTNDLYAAGLDRN